MSNEGDIKGAFPVLVQNSRLLGEARSPGILVLAPTMRILYVNRRAWELAGMAGQVRPWDSTELPPVIAEVCAIVRTALETWTESGHHGPIDYKRVTGQFGRRVQIHGFGLPNRLSFQQSRIVIVLDELNDVPSHHGDSWDHCVDQPISMLDVA